MTHALGFLPYFQGNNSTIPGKEITGEKNFLETQVTFPCIPGADYLVSGNQL